QAGGRAGGATGGVGVRGPGETQLEIDRREIGRRMAFLRRELEHVRTHRQQYRARRRKSHLPLIALVGYTNAGKSTLLNALTHANVRAEDQLFATLDPTTRRFALPSGREALMTDTVGFIQKLPTQLVAAFRATLEEIREADLLLHVVDASHPNAAEQAAIVREVLDELNASHIPALVALNKIDLLPSRDLARLERVDAFADAAPVSALTGQGLDELLERLELALTEAMVPIQVLIPYEAGELVDVIHRLGVVSRQSHEPNGILIAGRVPASLLGRLNAYRRVQIE
ncbi:MAG: GTPase HflX, partial [Chloroflexi bacterium]|nr:GTPase HflX [Chloroflexota bacterium]